MLVLERQNVVILKPHKPSPLHRPLTQVSFKDSNRRRKNKQGGNVGVWDDRRGARGRLRAHRVFRTLPINLGSYLGRFCSFFLSPNIFFGGKGYFVVYLSILTMGWLMWGRSWAASVYGINVHLSEAQWKILKSDMIGCAPNPTLRTVAARWLSGMCGMFPCHTGGREK